MTRKVTILATTDLHGLYFDGHITPRSGTGTLARIREFVTSVRQNDPAAILLDAGDFMGGGIASHWSNHVARTSPHIPASMANETGYDAMCPGNHDLDIPPETFGRCACQLNAPVVACNIKGIDSITPYTIIRRGDIRVAVIGSVTAEASLLMLPGARRIPQTEAISNTVSEIRQRHHPDLIVGLFHDGPEECRAMAHEVAGIDVIFCGHVHSDIGVFDEGDTVIVNPGPYGLRMARADISITADGHRTETSVIDLPVVKAPPMPREIREFGDTIITDRPASIDELVRLALLQAFPDALPVIEESGISTTSPLTIAETFRHLPYDDHILRLIDPASPNQPISVTTYLHSHLYPHLTPTQTSPKPLRCYLYGGV